MEVCLDPHYNIIFHTCCPAESKISHLKQFQVISCFQICHSDACSVIIYCNLIPNLIESTPERILFPNQYIPNSKY